MCSASKPGKLKIFLIAAASLIVILVVIIICQGAAPIKPAAITTGDYSYTREYTEYRINKLMKRYHLPSVAIALIDDQEVVWQDAFGLANIEENQPAEIDTVYKLWSVAKVFTAIETMRLVEENLIDLDAPLTAYLSDFSIQSRFPDPGTITIRNMLAQRAGLPRHGCTWVEHSPAELGELAASLENCHLISPVETRYKYSNIGLDILGYIIEESRDELFPFYLQKSLLAPLGMNNSSFLKETIPVKRDIALGYEYYKGEYYAYEQNDVSTVASGNLYSTVQDMGEFVKFIFRGGEANGEQIIAQETLQMMYENQFSGPKDPQTQGLGWKIGPDLGAEQMIWHDGGPSEGTGALVAMLPEQKLGVVVFANSTSFEGNLSAPFAAELLELMLETKYGTTAYEETIPEPVDVERTILERYTGKYIAFGEVMEIYSRGGRLRGKIKGISFRLTPIGEAAFQPGSWLMDIGLGKLLKMPIDFSKLTFNFIVENEHEKDMVIINFSGLHHEFCPRYPDIREALSVWEKITGEYNLFARLPSGEFSQDMFGKAFISIDDGILRLEGVIGPVLPISEKELIILSGAYAGETMTYDQESGHIFHQKFVFIKSDKIQ